jgi:L-ascorbate metabolism protein UlaG (beta-lactamase superfamily)
MEIVWLGHSCFRIRGREAIIVTDPCPPATGYRFAKVTADIVTLSHDHENHTHLKAVSGKPTVLDGPGEYEIHGAFITSIVTYHDKQQGATLGRNLTFVVEMEGMRVCHLGDLGHTPTASQVEEMAGVDVLMVPVGGGTTLDGPSAAEVVNLLEPRLVIPMHYQTDATAEKMDQPGTIPMELDAKAAESQPDLSGREKLDPPDRFLKEMGAKASEPQPKLSVTRSGLPHETQVVLLDYKR